MRLGKLTAAVRPFCEQNNFSLLHYRKKASVSHFGNIVSTVQALRCGPQVSLSCTGDDTITVQCCQKPVEFFSRLQPAEHRTTYCQELQYDFMLVRSLIAVPHPCVVHLSHCESTYKQCQNENYINQLSVISFQCFSAFNDDCAMELKSLRRTCRWPRFNCKRKLLHVHHNSRHRKPVATSCNFLSASTDSSPSDNELLDSCDGCDFMENTSVSADGRHSLLQLLSPVHNLVTHVEDSTVCVSSYCSPLSLLSSFCDIQATHTEEFSSFASSLFVSGKEMDSSDCCCTDSDESDCSELQLSSIYSTNGVLPECLVTELPCFSVPFTDNWVLGFSDCTAASLDSEFEVYFEEDGTYIPCNKDEAVCSYSLGVKEANNRWNEAYSVPADFFSTSSERHNRMVCLHDSVHWLHYFLYTYLRPGA